MPSVSPRSSVDHFQLVSDPTGVVWVCDRDYTMPWFKRLFVISSITVTCQLCQALIQCITQCDDLYSVEMYIIRLKFKTGSYQILLQW